MADDITWFRAHSTSSSLSCPTPLWRPRRTRDSNLGSSSTPVPTLRHGDHTSRELFASSADALHAPPMPPMPPTIIERPIYATTGVHSAPFFLDSDCTPTFLQHMASPARRVAEPRQHSCRWCTYHAPSAGRFPLTLRRPAHVGGDHGSMLPDFPTPPSHPITSRPTSLQIHERHT